MARGVKSIWTRKLDLLYMVFFTIHVPIMLMIDLYEFYPVSIRPQFMTSLRTFYIDTYRDRFFISPPTWFHGFTYLELFYHIPLSIWAVPALLRDDPMVPLHLLIFALEAGGSTFVCVLELLSWQGYTYEEKKQLCSLYLPYLALALLMGTDMYLRLKRVILAKVKHS